RGPRQGLLLSSNRNAVRKPPRRSEFPGRIFLPCGSKVTSRRRSRHPRVSGQEPPARRHPSVLAAPPAEIRARSALPLEAALLEELLEHVQRDPLDDHAGRRALLREPESQSVASEGRH